MDHLQPSTNPDKLSGRGLPRAAWSIPAWLRSSSALPRPARRAHIVPVSRRRAPRSALARAGHIGTRGVADSHGASTLGSRRLPLALAIRRPPDRGSTCPPAAPSRRALYPAGLVYYDCPGLTDPL